MYSIQGNFGSESRDFIGLFDGHGGFEVFQGYFRGKNPQVAAYVGSVLHKNLLEELNKGNSPNEAIIRAFEVTNEGCHAYLQKSNGLQRRIGCTGTI